MELRAPSTPADWAVYHAIRRRVLFELRGHGSTYNSDHPDEHSAGNHPFVLYDGQAAVGVIRIDVRDDVAIFRRVAIRDDLQRRGYGRRLLDLAAQFAVQSHCRRIDSHVDAAAVRFYRKCGFATVTGAESTGSTVLMTRSLV